ncbi:MAG: autotransporter outer membrane beta-barrel domain-containing protein [Planctomycetaceae bacterium]|jgi:uncharacterized protein with beta-barrel porin domain|nr:autotransporter outer membrane beta-barrel domain-containing protein [Planctomycetaceae bacterium]
MNGGTVTLGTASEFGDLEVGGSGSTDGNGTINLNGGNLILLEATSGYNSGGVYVNALGNGQINIKSGVKISTFGKGHVIESKNISIADGSTIVIDTAGLADDGTETALTIGTGGNVITLPTSGKFNLDVLATDIGTFKLIEIASANLINSKVKATLNSGNDRLGITGNFIYDTDNVRVVITTSGLTDTERVATWDLSGNTGTWGPSSEAWKLDIGSSKFFKDNDKVVFDKGAVNEAKIITVTEGGVKISNKAAGNTGDAMIVNSVAGYTFDGGKITVTEGDITKSGNGKLTIKNEIDLSNASIGSAVKLTAGETVLDGLIRLDSSQFVTVGNGATLSGGSSYNAYITAAITGGTLVFEYGSYHRPGRSPERQHFESDIQYRAGAKIVLDLGRTYDTSDLISTTKSIDFVSNGAGQSTDKVSVLVTNSDDLYIDENATDITVFEAHDKLKIAGTVITNNTAETATGDTGETKIAFTDDGGNTLEFEGVGLDLTEAKVTNNSTQLKLSAVGTVVPLSNDLTPNQRILYDSLASNPGTFANSLLFDILSLREDEAKLRAALEAALPTVNSALFAASQRNVVLSNRSNFNRLHFLQSARTRHSPNLNDAITLGQSYEPIYEWGDSCDLCDSVGSFGRCHGSHYNAWFEGFGNFLHQSNTDSIQGYRANTGGFNLGIDRQTSKYTVVGFSFGGAYTDMKTKDRTQWGDVEQYLFSVYSSHTHCNVTIALSGGYAHSEYKLSRNPGGTQLDSKHCGDQFFASFEIAAKMSYVTFDLTPFLAFDYINLDEGAYNELDAAKVAQSRINSQNSDSYLQTLGVRIGRTKYVNGRIVNPSIIAGWVHDYGNGNIYTTAKYEGGQQFTIQGAPMNKNRGLFGVGLDVALSPNLSLFSRYDGEFSKNSQIQTAQAGLNYKY